MLVVYNQLHPSSFYLNLFHSVYYSIHTDFFHRLKGPCGSFPFMAIKIVTKNTLRLYVKS